MTSFNYDDSVITPDIMTALFLSYIIGVQVCQTIPHRTTKEINMDENKTEGLNVLAGTKGKSLKCMTHPSVLMLQMATHI